MPTAKKGFQILNLRPKNMELKSKKKNVLEMHICQNFTKISGSISQFYNTSYIIDSELSENHIARLYRTPFQTQFPQVKMLQFISQQIFTNFSQRKHPNFRYISIPEVT